MPETTHPEFNHSTEALEVAKAFADGIRGKTVLVTGGNANGLAFATCQAFASQSPARLIIASRTEAKITESIALLKADYPNVDYRPLVVNLGSQASVRAAASTVLAWTDIPTIDLLINCAGVMAIPERTLTEDGIEAHFAINHIGHFLLTNLLMPKLLASASKNPKGTTRVINLSSASPLIGNMRWSDLSYTTTNKDLPEAEQPFYDFLETWGYKGLREMSYIGLEAYNVSKIANVLFSIGATNRLYEAHGILVLAVHPGIIQTELSRDFPEDQMTAVMGLIQAGTYATKTLGGGASTTMVAALDPKLGPGVTKNGVENYGCYLADCQISEQVRPQNVTSEAAERLWKLSEEMVKQEFTY